MGKTYSELAFFASASKSEIHNTRKFLKFVESHKETPLPVHIIQINGRIDQQTFAPNKYILRWGKTNWLHTACRFKSLSAVGYMLFLGANPYGVDYESRQNALHIATKHGSRRMLRYLLEGAKAYYKKHRIEKILNIILRESTILLEDTRVELLSRGLSYPDKTGNTPFHIAAREGHTDFIKIMARETHTQVIDKSLRTRNNNYDTPLSIAVKKGDCKMVEVLCRMGANPNAKTDVLDGERLLHYAARKNASDIMKILIKYNADINRSSSYRFGTYDTPLHTAVKHGSIECIEVLLQATATVEYRSIGCIQISNSNSCLRIRENAKNKMPFDYIIEAGNLDMLKVFFRYGQDPDFKLRSGQRLIDVAELHHQQEIVDYLLDMGAKPGSQQRMGCFC